MSNTLNRENYLAIADWMLDLDLNTRELLTYALIYGFSQDSKSCYYGSLSYLASWLGIEDRTNATRYLKPLVDKGLVVKSEVRSINNQRCCLYRTTENRGDITKDPEVDYIIVQPWMLHTLHLTGKDLLLYALVYGYSRKGSENVCSYQKNYFAKWLCCRKDNVARQIERAIKNGLIREEKGGFVAVVPENLQFPQIDNTPGFEEVDFTQIDNTFPHFDNTSSLKLTTNNLYIDNLEDNLSYYSNNNSNTKDMVFSSEEELSVVVNRDIYSDEFELDSEKDAFTYKRQHDYRLYRKYKKRFSSIESVMQKYSVKYFRILLAGWPDTSRTGRAEELFIDTVCSPKFKDRQKDILGLSSEKTEELFSIALDLFDPDNAVRIRKNKKAYLIGVLDIMLQELQGSADTI